MRRTISITAAALFALAVAAPVASATDYPPPNKPGTPQPKPSGKGNTLQVCPKLTKKAKKQGCTFTSVQKAIDKAKAGDTVKLADGVYGEGVTIESAKKRYLKLVGNKKNPQKVMFDKSKIKKPSSSASNKQQEAYNEAITNAVKINGANEVTLDGLAARNYIGNGFFVVNNDGYTFNHLFAKHVGVYGIYAFNTIGGSISNSEASENNDAGYYIGQTPVQAKPKQTFVTNVISHTNVLGWSGTNMRYVTIKKSFFYNNGAGIVPNALPSEKFPPDEDNVIIDNDIFLNNFDYYKGAPFLVQKTSAGDIPYPVGVGLLLFGGRNNTVEGNRVYGNKMVALGALEGLAVKDKFPADAPLVGNRVRNNILGNGGKNKNGRDLFYDGNGTGNCFEGNTPAGGVTVPAAPSPVFTEACADATKANSFDAAAQGQAVSWAVVPDQRAGWIQYPQAAVKDPAHPGQNVVPLEVYKP